MGFKTFKGGNVQTVENLTHPEFSWSVRVGSVLGDYRFNFTYGQTKARKRISLNFRV